MTRPTDDQLRKLGASLREIDPSTLNPDEEGASMRWFLGENATELFAWIHGEAPPHHIQLVFARVSAEWDRSAGLSTGRFDDATATAGGRYDPYLMTVSSGVDADVCRAALVLLSHSKVDSGLSAPLVEALTTAVGKPG